jgi:hypothetical protein
MSSGHLQNEYIQISKQEFDIIMKNLTSMMEDIKDIKKDITLISKLVSNGNFNDIEPGLISSILKLDDLDEQIQQVNR